MPTKKEPVWAKFLTARDRKVLAASGYGARQGFGKRPALIIIDVNYNFTGDEPMPILESIKKRRNACGLEAWESVKSIRRLIDACRAKGLPIIYTTSARREDGWDATSWSWKNARELEDVEEDLKGNEIVAEIAPQPTDIMIPKMKPSAFYGTNLNSFLVYLNVDSLLVTGVSTSGCVRATVIDAFSENYRVSIVEEGCFDRLQVSHAANLCDMHAKYADVVSEKETLAHIRKLPKGLFKLPSGKTKVKKPARKVR